MLKMPPQKRFPAVLLCAAFSARRALWFLKSARSFTPRATRSRAIGRGAAGVSLEDILEELIAERTSLASAVSAPRSLDARRVRRRVRSMEDAIRVGRAITVRPNVLPSRGVETELLTSRVPPSPAQAIKLAKDELVKRDRKNKTHVADALDLVNLLAKATNGTLESPAEVLQAIGVAWQAINASNATAARASRADGKGRPSAHASDAPAADLADALLLVQSRWLEEGLEHRPQRGRFRHARRPRQPQERQDGAIIHDQLVPAQPMRCLPPGRQGDQGTTSPPRRTAPIEPTRRWWSRCAR